ncbi:6-phosphogluconolactonase, partial [bacterium]|nr:6-phosphogluconolactonase [bacterium]
AAVAASPAVAGLAARIGLHFWVGDERGVPADSPDRNGAAIAAALAGARVALHRWPEGDRAAACALYAEEILTALGPVPVFDLAILGMGADGHTAGLFSMDQVRASEAPGILTLATQAPSPPRDRMTIGAALLRRSRSVVVLLRGGAKADALRAALEGRPCPAASVAGRNAAYYYLER